MTLKRKTPFLILGSIILVLVVVSGFFMWQYLQLKNSSGAVTDEITQRLVTKIGNLYAIPTDEKPTAAEVSDKEKLKEQPFFKNAENGDYVLIFTNAKLAILYREKDNKLINVGPIAISDGNAAKKDQPQQAKVSVKVINGTNKAGLAATVGGQLSGKLPALVNVDPAYSDAKKKNVTKTIVVDINKNKADAAKQIADALGGQVGELPAGEEKPNTDILVIAGQ